MTNTLPNTFDNTSPMSPQNTDTVLEVRETTNKKRMVAYVSILLIIIVLAVAVVVFFVAIKSQTQKTPEVEAPVPITDPTVGWKTLNIDFFEIKYPTTLVALAFPENALTTIGFFTIGSTPQFPSSDNKGNAVLTIRTIKEEEYNAQTDKKATSSGSVVTRSGLPGTRSGNMTSIKSGPPYYRVIILEAVDPVGIGVLEDIAISVKAIKSVETIGEWRTYVTPEAIGNWLISFSYPELDLRVSYLEQGTSVNHITRLTDRNAVVNPNGELIEGLQTDIWFVGEKPTLANTGTRANVNGAPAMSSIESIPDEIRLVYEVPTPDSMLYLKVSTVTKGANAILYAQYINRVVQTLTFFTEDHQVPVSAWNTYTDSAIGSSFKYPPELLPTPWPSVSEKTLAMFVSKDFLLGTEGVQQAITLRGAKFQFTVKDLPSDSWVKNLCQATAVTSPTLRCGQMTVNNHPAARVVNSGVGITFYVEVEGTLVSYAIDFPNATANDKKRYEELFNQIIYTVQYPSNASP